MQPQNESGGSHDPSSSICHVRRGDLVHGVCTEPAAQVGHL